MLRENRSPGASPSSSSSGSDSPSGSSAGTSAGSSESAGTSETSGAPGEPGASGSSDSPDSPDSTDKSASGGVPSDNPFAPPPEGSPDRPWQPRRPPRDSGGGQDDGGHSPWSGQWSGQQPDRSTGGGFGDRPGRQNGPEGPTGPGGPGGAPRWDPTDPVQRRARYALLGGMWAFFFAIFSWTYVALLLGALSLYWGISALRSKPGSADGTPASGQSSTADGGTTATAFRPASAPPPDGRPAGATPTGAARQQMTAAVSGIVTASLALLMVAGVFSAQLIYRDYYTCVNDALTTASQQSCDHLMPKDLRPLLGIKD
ncbi:hypothetical protein GBW32_22770 [Streptomyces tsukubensis]|nr:hypothetical protein [Streptomyces tsukubensis]QFR97955.1 hypothetical protein GBW32_22770 [Streptomyces tsukubensis]